MLSLGLSLPSLVPIPFVAASVARSGGVGSANRFIEILDSLVGVCELGGRTGVDFLLNNPAATVVVVAWCSNSSSLNTFADVAVALDADAVEDTTNIIARMDTDFLYTDRLFDEVVTGIFSI